MPSKGLMTLLPTSPPPLVLGDLWGGRKWGQGRTTFQIRMPAKQNDQRQRGSGSGSAGRAGRWTR